MKKKPIDRQTLKNWKSIMFDTTYDAIQAETGLSRPTLVSALKDGRATQNTITLLTKYFNNFTIPA